MKLVCIDPSQYWLTVGKIYDAESYFKPEVRYTHDTLFTYIITNDLGIRHAAEGFLFVELDKVRNQKLKTLLKEH